MFVVGLTGGIGSGKSEAARLFAALGVPVIDTDAIARQLTAPGQPALQMIASAFGRQALMPDGSLDRGYLRGLVFSEPQARKTLESILHPRIRAEVDLELQKNPAAPYQVVVVPLLFETGGYDGIISRSLVIDCSEALQVQRVMARSHLAETEVRAIMAAQLPRERRLALADDVISNGASQENLAAQVKAQHEKYIKACIVSQSIS